MKFSRPEYWNEYVLSEEGNPAGLAAVSTLSSSRTCYRFWRVAERGAPSAQRLVWAAKQALGKAALGALFA